MSRFTASGTLLKHGRSAPGVNFNGCVLPQGGVVSGYCLFVCLVMCLHDSRFGVDRDGVADSIGRPRSGFPRQGVIESHRVEGQVDHRRELIHSWSGTNNRTMTTCASCTCFTWKLVRTTFASSSWIVYFSFLIFVIFMNVWMFPDCPSNAQFRNILLSHFSPFDYSFPS